MKQLLLILFSLLGIYGFGQNYRVETDSFTIPGLPGVQAYAGAYQNGIFWIVGGRLDGLHKRQANSSFDDAGMNKRIYRVDLQSKTVLSVPVSIFPTPIAEQLSSTNMEHTQHGDSLILVGGYGFSQTVGNHITHDRITILFISKLDSVIRFGRSANGCYQSFQDARFQVTGGYLRRVSGAYMLTGGNTFTGRYNPMGGPSYTQVYQTKAQTFWFADSIGKVSVKYGSVLNDANKLHRRDYNVLPYFQTPTVEGEVVFSGVFQVGVNLPYLDAVEVSSAGIQPVPQFSQYYNHYHCANTSVYYPSKQLNEFYFLGGISQYYDSLGMLVQDNNVPFVKTISKVRRDSNGVFSEYKNSSSLPGFFGAASEFFINENLQVFDNEVINGDLFQGDSVKLGFMYGGIKSSSSNIFTVNTGVESSASNVFFNVWLVKSSVNTAEVLNPHSINGLNLQVFPNPSNQTFWISFSSSIGSNGLAKIYDETGRCLWQQNIVSTSDMTKLEIEIPESISAGIYFFELDVKGKKVVQKLVINKR